MGCRAKISKLIPAALALDWKLDCWISFGATFILIHLGKRQKLLTWMQGWADSFSVAVHCGGTSTLSGNSFLHEVPSMEFCAFRILCSAYCIGKETQLLQVDKRGTVVYSLKTTVLTFRAVNNLVDLSCSCCLDGDISLLLTVPVVTTNFHCTQAAPASREYLCAIPEISEAEQMMGRRGGRPGCSKWHPAVTWLQ